MIRNSFANNPLGKLNIMTIVIPTTYYLLPCYKLPIMKTQTTRKWRESWQGKEKNIEKYLIPFLTLKRILKLVQLILRKIVQNDICTRCYKFRVQVWHSSAQPLLIHLIFLMQQNCLCQTYPSQWPLWHYNIWPIRDLVNVT